MSICVVKNFYLYLQIRIFVSLYATLKIECRVFYNKKSGFPFFNLCGLETVKPSKILLCKLLVLGAIIGFLKNVTEQSLKGSRVFEEKLASFLGTTVP